MASRLRLPALLPLLLVAACGGTSLESFPSLVTTGRAVHDERTIPWLDDAVQEYVDIHGLPVEQGGLVGGRLTTEWFPVARLDEGLAECPARNDVEAVQLPEPRYRARYRFTLLPRAGHTVLRVEAHWQRETSPAGFREEERWVDCPSTGEWERATEERLVLRASLMPLGG